MNAVQFSKYGGPEVLEYIKEAPKPEVRNGKVLIEVYAASLNPFDYKLRNGIYKEKMPVNFPSTIGGDFAGVVREIGPGVSNFHPGDEVFGQAGVFAGGSGTLAEWVSANPEKIALKPDNVGFEQAAALSLAGLSALQGIEEHINIKAGQKILIHGGAGGIGSLAVQIAKSAGAYVVATARGDQIDFVRNLGVVRVIDFETEDFEDEVKDFDAVFDTAGGETARKSVNVLRAGGILVSMVEHLPEDMGKERKITVISQSTSGNGEKLKRLAGLVEEGNLRIQVDKVFRLDEGRQAFQYLEQGRPKGKVVVTIK